MLSASCSFEDRVDHIRDITSDVTRNANESSIQLLRDVNNVVDALARLQNMYGKFVELLNQARDRVRECKPERVIDHDNTMRSLFESAEGALQVQMELLRKKLTSAHADPKLRGDNRDAVVTEFERTINATAALHNALVDARLAVMEHDADLADISGTFNTPEELLAHLKTL